jgi:hypothetical protein
MFVMTMRLLIEPVSVDGQATAPVKKSTATMRSSGGKAGVSPSSSTPGGTARKSHVGRLVWVTETGIALAGAPSSRARASAAIQRPGRRFVTVKPSCRGHRGGT